jgi:hypothetical protein
VQVYRSSTVLLKWKRDTDVLQGYNGYRSNTGVEECYGGTGKVQRYRGTGVEEFFSFAGIQEKYSDTIGPDVV